MCKIFCGPLTVSQFNLTQWIWPMQHYLLLPRIPTVVREAPGKIPKRIPFTTCLSFVFFKAFNSYYTFWCLKSKIYGHFSQKCILLIGNIGNHAYCKCISWFITKDWIYTIGLFGSNIRKVLFFINYPSRMASGTLVQLIVLFKELIYNMLLFICSD